MFFIIAATTIPSGDHQSMAVWSSCFKVKMLRVMTHINYTLISNLYNSWWFPPSKQIVNRGSGCNIGYFFEWNILNNVLFWDSLYCNFSLGFQNFNKDTIRFEKNQYVEISNTLFSYIDFIINFLTIHIWLRPAIFNEFYFPHRVFSRIPSLNAIVRTVTSVTMVNGGVKVSKD